MAGVTESGINDRQRLFAQEYVACLNATTAAKRAGYSEKTARQIGTRNMSVAGVRAEINRLLAERKMSGEEVISRLEQHAKGDLGDCLSIREIEFTRGRGKNAKTETIRRPEIDIEKVMRLGLTHLIRKVRTDPKSGNIVAIEFYDAQRALALLGRHHRILGNPDDRPGEDDDENDDISDEEIADELGRP